MRPTNLKQDVQPLSEFRSDVGEFENFQIRLELLESLYKAETQINEGCGIVHEDAKSMVMKSIKT